MALKRDALESETSTIRLADRQVVMDGETMRQLLALDWSAWSWTVDAVVQLVTKAGKGCLVLERYLAVGRTLLPKALRNAYGAHCMENGMDLFSLHGLLGHLYIDTTEFIWDMAVHRFRASYDASHPLAVRAVTANSGPSEIHGLLQASSREESGGDSDEDWADGWDDEELLRGGSKPADLEESEVQAMLDAAGSGDPIDRLILLVIYAAGLRHRRRGEAAVCRRRLRRGQALCPAVERAQGSLLSDRSAHRRASAQLAQWATAKSSRLPGLLQNDRAHGDGCRHQDRDFPEIRRYGPDRFPRHVPARLRDPPVSTRDGSLWPREDAGPREPRGHADLHQLPSARLADGLCEEPAPLTATAGPHTLRTNRRCHGPDRPHGLAAG